AQPHHAQPPHPTQDFTPEQRARWVMLATRSADEANLPADPEFRAALASYLVGSARASDVTARGWGWAPAGPPAEAPAQASAADDQEKVTLPGPDETVG